MNIGGLFAAEAYRVRPNTHLTALQHVCLGNAPRFSPKLPVTYAVS